MRKLLHDGRLLLAFALLGSCGIQLLQPLLDPYLLDVAVGAGINVLLVLSLNLVNGHAGQFSLGHAGFMAVGAYLSSWISLQAPDSLRSDSASPVATGLFFLLALLAGGLGASIAGAAVGAPSLRLKGDYLALVTLGFGEIIRVLIQNCEPLGGALGLIGMPAWTNLGWTLAWISLCAYFVYALTTGAQGLAFHAVRDDEIAARAVGIDTTRIKMKAFITGAFFAGVAGGLFAHFKLAIDPRGFDFSRSVEIVVMVILGSSGSAWGLAASAILLTVLPEVLRPLSEYRMVLYAAILVGVMILRPKGLFGTPRPPTPPAPTA